MTSPAQRFSYKGFLNGEIDHIPGQHPIMSTKEEYRQWPFLTQEEFDLACAYLDQKYIKTNLGQTRKLFKLRQGRVATTGSSYIEIIRVLEVSDDGVLSLELEKLSYGGGGPIPETEIHMDMNNEDADFEALRSNVKETSTATRSKDSRPDTDCKGPQKYRIESQQPYVVYEIHLHPVYSVPTLWFTLHDLPADDEDKTFDIESVYRYLVPPRFKTRLREIGSIGGISADFHPVTEVPAFFIHPCSSPEAMKQFNCSLEDYLMIWLGLVGGCVGLYVPSEMAQDQPPF
jgi:ubiquitin-like-conjugating enzyme ATG10